MEPQIRFCAAADGVRIAYATQGRGPAILVAYAWISNMERLWNHPVQRGFTDRMASDFLFVNFDRRGIGASQRTVDDVSVDAHVRDISAVADALQLERFHLFGSMDSAAVAVAYASEHPHRVQGLVLEGPLSHGGAIGGMERARGIIELIRTNWPLARRALADILFPRGPTELQAWFAELLRESMSAETAAQYVEFGATLDIRELLPKVTTPTLILHGRGDRRVPIHEGRNLAAMMPNARFVATERAFDWSETVMQAIEDFVGEGAEAPRELPEGMTAILFAGIADSTGLTERLGDTPFRAKARELDGSLREAIRENGGTPVEGKLLGDGVLAVFTSARQAIEAALRCGKAGDECSLPLHLGVHAGDVIREEGNVYGGAVNIAARIAAASAPGEVLVSQTVRDLARTSAGVAFEDMGGRELKGIEEPVRLFAVRAQPDG